MMLKEIIFAAFIIQTCHYQGVESNETFIKSPNSGWTGLPKFHSKNAFRCDYCGLSSHNTYCLYGSSTNIKCSGPLQVGLNDAEEKEALDHHNYLRRQIANGQVSGYPSASNMRKLVWNEELARGAQLWANQCKFGHDSADTCKFYVGQNLYYSSGYGRPEDVPQPNVTQAIQSWYDEISLFNGNVGSYYFNPATGHFTQVIWAETTDIGCAFISYGGRKAGTSEGDSMESTKMQAVSKYYVCNYGPGGNFVGTPIYKSGSPCSQCPEGTVCEDGLCAPSNNAEITSQGDFTPPPPESVDFCYKYFLHFMGKGPFFK